MHTASCPLSPIYHICPFVYSWHCALSFVFIIKSPELAPQGAIYVYFHTRLHDIACWKFSRSSPHQALSASLLAAYLCRRQQTLHHCGSCCTNGISLCTNRHHYYFLLSEAHFTGWHCGTQSHCWPWSVTSKQKFLDISFMFLPAWKPLTPEETACKRGVSVVLASSSPGCKSVS